MTLFVEKKSTSDHGVDYVVHSDDDYIAYRDPESYSFEPNPSNNGAVRGATVSPRPAIYTRKYSTVFVSCVIISCNSALLFVTTPSQGCFRVVGLCI